MSMKLVVIIDDMLHDSEIIKNHTEAIYLGNENQAFYKKNIDEIDMLPYLTHADICAKVMRKYCADIRLINIVIKETFENGNISDLINALYFAENLNADVVHMSVGTNERFYINHMHRAIKQLASKTKVVAARANNGRKTFPADFPEVIGCRISSGKDIQYLGKNNYALPGSHLIRAHNNDLFYTKASNSFAAAYYTGLYCSDKI